MQDEYYPETNDRFSISSPAIEEALVGIRDKIGGSGGSGANTEAYTENYLETNDRFSISSPVIEELLWEIRDAIGGGSTGGFEIVVDNGVATSYRINDAIIPDGVTSIGAGAFSSCLGLTQINLPDGITSVGPYAFNSCYGLTQVNIPDGITSIGFNAFYEINANAVINCGFAEGAVSGAPWGAPETVTINYNVPQP